MVCATAICPYNSLFNPSRALSTWKFDTTRVFTVKTRYVRVLSDRRLSCDASWFSRKEYPRHCPTLRDSRLFSIECRRHEEDSCDGPPHMLLEYILSYLVKVVTSLETLPIGDLEPRQGPTESLYSQPLLIVYDIQDRKGLKARRSDPSGKIESGRICVHRR